MTRAYCCQAAGKEGSTRTKRSFGREELQFLPGFDDLVAYPLAVMRPCIFFLWKKSKLHPSLERNDSCHKQDVKTVGCSKGKLGKMILGAGFIIRPG